MIIITISLHCPGIRNLHPRMHFCYILPGIIPTRCFFWISILIFLIIHIIILVLCFFLFSEKCIYKAHGNWKKKISFRLHYSHYSFLSVSYVWDCCNIWSWTFVCSLLLYFSSFLHKTQENVLFITHNILSCLCTWFSFDVSLDYGLYWRHTKEEKEELKLTHGKTIIRTFSSKH